MRLPRSHLLLLALAGLAGGLASGGCYLDNDGLEPPAKELYFPTGLAVSPGGTALYVANSDFDLKYNGGTVQLVNLPALRAVYAGIAAALASGSGVTAACAAGGLTPNDAKDQLLYPGPCQPLPLAGFVTESRSIGAFASGATLVHNSDGPGARLFVPVRGDPSITYFDVTDDRVPGAPVAPCAGGACLECAALTAGDDKIPRCGPNHRIGESPTATNRGLTLPPEPVDVAASADGSILVATPQTETTASLITNKWPTCTEAPCEPTLEFFLNTLPQGPTEVVSLPVPAFAKEAGASFRYQPGFLVTFRAAAELDLLRYQPDDDSTAPARPFLTRAAAVGINANADGQDSRGIAIDAEERKACEVGCAAEGDAAVRLACLRGCTEIPIGVYVANRTPPTLLVGKVETRIVDTGETPTSALDDIDLYDTVPLGFGASRVLLGRVIGKDGLPHRRIFAVAFDSRAIFIYDPEARRIEAAIHTGRGPHDITFDVGPDPDGDGDPIDSFSYMLVGHFTDSYLGVVDLDQRRSTFGQMIANIGVPVPPPESK